MTTTLKHIATAIGLGLLIAGCESNLSEEGEKRCLERAANKSSEFVAKKTYENCKKSVMAEISEGERIARAKTIENQRIADLENKRSSNINEQKKKFELYANWRFWVSRVDFPSEIVKPLCVVDGLSEEIEHKIFKDRYGKRDPSMDYQSCFVKDSVVFNKDGFKVIELSSSYGDMGANPPGPRGSEDSPGMKFPELEIFATYVNCNTKEESWKPFTRISTLNDSDPTIIAFGNGEDAIRVLGTKDPVTKKRLMFPRPMWVNYSNHDNPISLGVPLHKETLEKIVYPICSAHAKFWDNSKR